MSYSPHGAMSAMRLGNQKWEHTIFNNRLQPAEIGLGISSADSSLLKLEYSYNSTGQANNNGNVREQKITAGGELILTQSYGYDALNRLASVSENGSPSFTEQFSYDRFGNMWVSGFSGITLSSQTPQGQSSFNQSTNRLSQSAYPNVQYDGAGNLTRDAVGSTFAYDGENRQTTSSVAAVTASYTYDGEGRRVKKAVGTVTTVFVYNVEGQMIAEYATDPVPPVSGGGGTSYLTMDMLGSTRVVTKSDGSVKARYDYLPFGEEIASSIGGRNAVSGYGSGDSTRQKFTSKERDAESGLDYFLARYYSSAQGRFTSPDEFTGGPVELYYFASQASANPTFYANLAYPQSLNKYQYCYNNPLRYLDPDGHDILDDLAEFGTGIARGYGASISGGTFPGSAPSEKDSTLSLMGQLIGTLIAAKQASEVTAGGLLITPETGPVGLGVAGMGALEAVGAAVNLAKIGNVLFNSGSDEGSNNSSGGASQDVEVRPGAPAVEGDPYSPKEVSKRQSETRRELNTGNLDPSSPIPEQKPGRNIKGTHTADKTKHHKTGERNVNPEEEHTRKAKGHGDVPRRKND